MAKIQGEDITTTPTPEDSASDEGKGLESGTPKSAAQVAGSLYPIGTKEGVRLAQPRREIVDHYPERPYQDAKAK